MRGPGGAGAAPFDLARLRADLGRCAIDLLLVASHYNLQYLLGGYRRFFFSVDDSLGLSRSAPVLGIPARSGGAPFYVGHVLESSQLAAEPLWVDDVELSAWSAVAVVAPTVRRVRALGLERATIGIEAAFLSAETYIAFCEQLPEARFIDSATILEDLRSVKQPYEIDWIRRATEEVVASIVSTFQQCAPGISTAQVERILRDEEILRGLDFVYGQVITGAPGHRYPSEARRWERGAALAIDSGGAFCGYLGDLTRMAVLGEPSALQRELLGEVDAIQMAARAAIRPGASGADIEAAVSPLIDVSEHRIDFIAEGTGLVGHEAPRLMRKSPLPDPGRHYGDPLAAGMVLGVETTLAHPEAGVVKLEDVVVVTDGGCEGVADDARDFTVVG